MLTTRLFLVRLHGCKKILGDIVLQLGVYLRSKMNNFNEEDREYIYNLDWKTLFTQGERNHV